MLLRGPELQDRVPSLPQSGEASGGIGSKRAKDHQLGGGGTLTTVKIPTRWIYDETNTVLLQFASFHKRRGIVGVGKQSWEVRRKALRPARLKGQSTDPIRRRRTTLNGWWLRRGKSVGGRRGMPAHTHSHSLTLSHDCPFSLSCSWSDWFVLTQAPGISGSCSVCGAGSQRLQSAQTGRGCGFRMTLNRSDASSQECHGFTRSGRACPAEPHQVAPIDLHSSLALRPRETEWTRD